MNRLELKYLLKEQIKHWSCGKYNDEELSKMNVSELKKIHWEYEYNEIMKEQLIVK